MTILIWTILKVSLSICSGSISVCMNCTSKEYGLESTHIDRTLKVLVVFGERYEGKFHIIYLCIL